MQSICRTNLIHKKNLDCSSYVFNSDLAVMFWSWTSKNEQYLKTFSYSTSYNIGLSNLKAQLINLEVLEQFYFSCVAIQSGTKRESNYIKKFLHSLKQAKLLKQFKFILLFHDKYERKSSKIIFETPFKSLLRLDALTEIAITLNVVKPLQYSHVWRIIGTNPLIKKVKILSDETDKYNTIPYLFDTTAEKIKLDTLELSGSKSLSDLYCITRFNSRMDIRHLFFTRKSREEVNMKALLAAVAYLEKYDPNNVRNIVPSYGEELIAYKRCIKDWRKKKVISFYKLYSLYLS